MFGQEKEKMCDRLKVHFYEYKIVLQVFFLLFTSERIAFRHVKTE